MKLKIAAKMTATRGGIARVEIDGRDDVGRVVEAVREVERQRRGDDDDEDDVGRHQAFLMTTLSRMCATRSHASIAASRRS